MTLMGVFFLIGMLLNIYLVWSFFITYVYKKGVAYVGRIYVNNDEKAIEELVNELELGKRVAHFVGGEARHNVYNDPRVKQAFRAFHRKPNADLRAVFWQELDRDENGVNGIEDLARDGVIELSFLDKRPSIHFRVIDPKTDDACVYIENEHDMGEENRTVQVIRGATLAGEELDRMFLKIEKKAERASFAS